MTATLKLTSGLLSFKLRPEMWTTTRCVVTSLKHQELKDASMVPGPFRTPLLGSAPAMLIDKNFDPTKVDQYMMYAFKKYGPIFRLDTFGLKTFFICDPDDIQKVLEATKENPARNGIESLKRIRSDIADNYFEGKYGLFIEDGEEWWRVRKRAQGPMMKPKIVKSYLNSHNQVALEFLDIIAELQTKHGEMPSNFQHEIYKWAVESVSLVALDRRLGCLNRNLPKDAIQLQLIENVNQIFEAMNEAEIGLRLWRLFETDAYKRLKKAQHFMVGFVDENIQKTVEHLKTKPEDADVTLMESLLKTNGLSYKDAVTMVLDMLTAGVDTTAHTIGFVLYLLSKNPEKQRKLQQEIDEIFGDRQDFTIADFAKLSYVKAVVKESLRLFPLVAGNIRVLQDDLELRGYLLPKGYGVMSVSLISSKDDKYFNRSSEFIPERWQRSRPLGPIHPFSTLPFGIGTRMCIGRRIAEQELYVLICRILQRYNVDYKYKDMGVKTKLVFAPSEPLKFSFTERKLLQSHKLSN